MLPLLIHTKLNFTLSIDILMKRNVYSFVPLIHLYILIYDVTL